MNDDLLLQGLATRRALSSQRDIDEAFDDANPYVQLFEEFATEQYWGGCWSDETLSHRERSWLSLGMAAATGRHRDFAAAVKTALNSGITESELRAATMQIVLWCGLAIGSDCVRVAREVISGANHPSPGPSGKRKQKPLAQTGTGIKVTALP
jgi:4-carboxymuconolactone decarboxylase